MGGIIKPMRYELIVAISRVVDSHRPLQIGHKRLHGRVGEASVARIRIDPSSHLPANAPVSEFPRLFLVVVRAVNATEGVDGVLVDWKGHGFRARIPQRKLEPG